MVSGFDPRVPTCDELMWPAIKAMKALYGRASNKELLEKVSELEGFSKDVQGLRPGNLPKLRYNLIWAQSELKRLGAFANDARGVWSITDVGKKMSQQDCHRSAPIHRSAPKIDSKGFTIDDLRQFPSVSRDNLAQLAVRIRRGQNTFRNKLLKIYEQRCAISGCEITEVLEASHITPYSEHGDYSPENGIILRSDLHVLFDIGLLKINPSYMTVALSERLRACDEYKELDGRKIFEPKNEKYRLNPTYLMQRWGSGLRPSCL